MRILMLSAYPREGGVIGGVATAAKCLVESLAQLPQMEEISVVDFDRALNGNEVIETSDKKVSIYHLPAQERWGLLMRWWPDFLLLRRFLKHQGLKPSLIHGQGFAVDGHLAIKLGQLLKIPVVITVHGMWDIETRLYGGRLRAYLARSMMHHTLGRASGVIFVSPYRMNELRALVSGQVYLIENPIADFSPQAFLDGQQRKEPIVLYAGVIRRLKRIIDLIKAFREVCEIVPFAQLRLVGPSVDPVYHTELNQLIDRLNLEDQVKLTGPADKKQMLREYACARVVVMASEQETAPQVIAEAMAAGVPVVATRVGGIPWMVQDGRNGYLVEVGNVERLAERIVELLTNQARWKAFSQCGRAAAERYRASRVATLTLETYQQVLQTAAAVGPR